jgi:hypothetical protein
VPVEPKRAMASSAKRRWAISRSMRSASARRIALRSAVAAAQESTNDRDADAQPAQHADGHCVADLLARV